MILKSSSHLAHGEQGVGQPAYSFRLDPGACPFFRAGSDPIRENLGRETHRPPKGDLKRGIRKKTTFRSLQSDFAPLPAESRSKGEGARRSRARQAHSEERGPNPQPNLEGEAPGPFMFLLLADDSRRAAGTLKSGGRSCSRPEGDWIWTRSRQGRVKEDKRAHHGS